ncbi:RNA polymerase sigma factor [Paenibacillus methanolicus]|uniref:RNA polymerase sigma-70 factor (ECF subfamily) n=1 Tax=Paenibacillus methanolicus TaxID=582686 RepID=A0A5S5CH68_9BACL|nr:RNA polymerase sigma factor [Paenibacillus methanolicus]TYP77852.1 RNA polymerase sigma-70 factor (ECF subfamily) [Paenibacillus methanolicus]
MSTSAQEASTTPWRQDLYRYCIRLTTSEWEAEDLVQETSLRALPYLTGERRHPNLQALLLRTAKNIWIDQCRRQRKLKTILNEQLEVCREAVEGMPLNAIETERLLSALNRSLSPLQLTIFLLRDVFQYTAVETAALLHTSEGAAKAALFRARRSVARLRHRLVAEDGTEEQRSEKERQFVRAYTEAFQSANTGALVALALTQVQSSDTTVAVGMPGFAMRQASNGLVQARAGSVVMALRAA